MARIDLNCDLLKVPIRVRPFRLEPQIDGILAQVFCNELRLSRIVVILEPDVPPVAEDVDYVVAGLKVFRVRIDEEFTAGDADINVAVRPRAFRPDALDTGLMDFCGGQL